MRIEDDVDRAGVFILEQDLRPTLAAIGRAENAALRVRTVGVADRRDINDVLILGVNDERADVAGVFQADVAPVAAAIDRFINAVAISDVAAQGRLAGAGVNRVVIARRDRESADRGGGVLLVEHRLPVLAAVGCFPNAARDAAEIISVRFIRHALDRDRASAAEGADFAPLHPAPEFFVELAFLRSRCFGCFGRRGRWAGVGKNSRLRGGLGVLWFRLGRLRFSGGR